MTAVSPCFPRQHALTPVWLGDPDIQGRGEGEGPHPGRSESSGHSGTSSVNKGARSSRMEVLGGTEAARAPVSMVFSYMEEGLEPHILGGSDDQNLLEVPRSPCSPLHAPGTRMRPAALVLVAAPQPGAVPGVPCVCLNCRSPSRAKWQQQKTSTSGTAERGLASGAEVQLVKQRAAPAGLQRSQSADRQWPL